jgi:hypothetical protein
MNLFGEVDSLVDPREKEFQEVLKEFFNDLFPGRVVFTLNGFLFPGVFFLLRAHDTLIIIQVPGFFNLLYNSTKKRTGKGIRLTVYRKNFDSFPIL